MAEFSSSTDVAPLDAVSKVELSISCTNLKDMDVFSKSDPVVFLYEKRGREWQKLGRTEVIDNNLNPKVNIFHCSMHGIILYSLNDAMWTAFNLYSPSFGSYSPGGHSYLCAERQISLS